MIENCQLFAFLSGTRSSFCKAAVGTTIQGIQWSCSNTLSKCTYLVTWVASIDAHTTLQPLVCCRKKWKSTKFTHLTVLPCCVYSHVPWTIFNCVHVYADPAPERYWELLAEERRLALQEALEENERVSFFPLYCDAFTLWTKSHWSLLHEFKRLELCLFWSALQRDGRA